MPYDQDRYRSLIARAAFDSSFYNGTIQDQSAAQRAMSFVGAPTWGKVNGLPCLNQNADNDGTITGNIASPVDVTGSFWFELLVSPRVFGNSQFLLHRNPGLAGFQIYRPGALSTTARIYMYDAAGGLARRVETTTAVTLNRHWHIVGASVNGGAAGFYWLNGVPDVAVLIGAGVAANGAGTPLEIGGGTGLNSFVIMRLWQGTPTKSDAQCLASAASQLVGGW